MSGKDPITSGEELTLWAIRLSIALYVAAVALWLNREKPGFARPARACWAGACLCFLVHVLLAFHFHHAWSHAEALKETARRTGELTGSSSGSGIYLNYLMAVVWAADAVWWLRDPAGYESRPPAIEIPVHAFFAFMFFNAVVVFGEGLLRGAGAVASVILVAMFMYGQFKPKAFPPTA